MSTPQGHRRLRELLGVYALGALPGPEAAGLRAHLDGCAACRAELAEIAPLAEDLRGVDPDALSELPAPPADLGQRIRQRVAHEGALVRARDRRDHTRQRVRRLAAVAAAVAVLAGVAGVGTVVGRSTAPVVVAAPSPSPSPAPAPPAAIPLEQVPVVTAAGLQVSSASVIAHTWGLEARFDGTGFAAGVLYRAAFRSADGALLPAGEFLGTGDATLKCNMQSALLRSAATGFVVTDQDGRTVLSAELPA